MKNRLMSSATSPEVSEMRDLEHYRPAVALIMPFEPKMSSRSDLAIALKRATDIIENKILDDYAGNMSLLVIQKLKRIIQSLNYNTHKKSLAIYVSPLFDKVLYLDIPVEERIIIDEDFNIRDLTRIKKQVHRYLVLVLSEQEYQMYFGSSDIFTRIVFNTSESVFSSAGMQGMESSLDQTSFFFDRIDKVLDVILSAYRLPLFVVGDAVSVSRFSTLTTHRNAVIDYVLADAPQPLPQSLKCVLATYTANWEQVRLKDISNQLLEARDKHKMVSGMQAVAHEAARGTGRLLVVAESYTCPIAVPAGTPRAANDQYRTYSYVKDAVDDAIEKVLLNGGDVELVPGEVLKTYAPIVLLKY
jgi:hypothetical protein